MLFTACRPGIAGVLLLLAFDSFASCEEAVDRTGRRYRGEFDVENGAWTFQTAGAKSLPLAQLSIVRFEPRAEYLPKVLSTKSLILSSRERIAGSLIRVDGNAIHFTASWGGAFKLAREHVVGIEHADGWLPLFRAAPASPLKAWKTEGKIAIDSANMLFDEPSIRLDQPGQRLERQWPPVVGDCRVRLFFRCSDVASSLRWTIDILPSEASLVIDKNGTRCAKVRESFGSLATDGRWHALSVERRSDVVRFFVDDHCLGQMPVEPFAGIRLSVSGSARPEGSLAIANFSVEKRLAGTRFPSNEPKQDSLGLIHDEQLFGKVVVGDETSVTLDGKLGKRTMPWTDLRGMGFAKTIQKPHAGDAEIYFLPGFGLSADCLQAKLIRWDKSKLIVEHAVLGLVAIERSRLQKIILEAK